MIFFIRYEDSEYRVKVESRDGKTFVTFEDEPEEAVDLVYYGHTCTFIRNHRVFFANIVGDKTEYTVWHPQGNLVLNVESEYRRIVNMLRGQALENENSLYSKMPGKIVKVLVNVGDRVKPGDTVLVMEAMKMENEIRASIDGDVSNINVSEGQTVETGELLLEFSGEQKA